MKRVVYLLGAGAVKAEMGRQSINSDVTMAGLNEAVYKMSRKCNGEYYRLTQRHPIPLYQDVELMISLLEGFLEKPQEEFQAIHAELRKLVRECLISQITQKNVMPRLMTSLFHLNRNYHQYMGTDGEKVLGVLTTNYDSLIEEASLRVYDGLNVGHIYKSKDYVFNEKAPLLLKLHGSFNWRIHDNKLQISRIFETIGAKDDYTGWIPPSVYKKPSTMIFGSIWNKARVLLSECDILKVIGSNLRNEDWCLISLIFTSKILNKKAFDIHLIVPEVDAVGDDDHPNSIMQRLPFLGEMKSLSDLPEKEYNVNMLSGNTFLQWLIAKVHEIEAENPSIGEDEVLNELLYGEE